MKPDIINVLWLNDLKRNTHGGALLTLLGATIETMPLQINKGRGIMARALTLLASPRFVHRPAANTDEVIERITAMRDDWELAPLQASLNAIAPLD
jgi:hypothetical protein